MKCINKSSKEFKKLMRDTGYSSIALAAFIGRWQSDNNSDEFPTFAQVLGVNTNTLEMFNEDGDYEQIGSPQQYAAYENSVENASKEGFQEYVEDFAMSDFMKASSENKPTIVEKLTSVDHTPHNAHVNFDTFHTESTEKAIFEFDSKESLRGEVERVFLNGKSTQNATMSDILNSIVENFTEELSESTKSLLNKALKINSITNVNVEIVEGDVLETGIIAQYDSDKNLVIIPYSLLESGNSEDVITSILHELVHARTVEAIANPETAEEVELVALIKEFIREFGGNSESYGFSDEFEFVAEFYSNPLFKNEVFKIINDSQKSKSLFNKIIDAIRRLFGVKKPGRYDNLMPSIMFMVDSSRYTGSVKNHGVFNLSHTANIPDFTTLSSTFKHVTNVVLDNLNKEHTHLRYSRTDRKYRDAAIVNVIQRIEDVKNTESHDRMKVIAGYLQDLQSGLIIKNTHIRRLESGVKSNLKDLKKIKGYEEYLALLDFVDVVDSYVANVIESNRTNKGKDLTVDEKQLYQEAQYYISEIKKVRNEVENKLLQSKKSIATKMISNPAFITIAENKMREKIGKAYDALVNPGMSKDQYFIKQMQNSVMKKELQSLVRMEAEAIVNNPSVDISTVELMLSDPSNIKSKMIDSAMSLVMSYREKIMSAFRVYDAVLSKAHKNLTSENRTNDMSKLYGKLIQENDKGVRFLVSKYKIELLDKYNALYDKVNERLYGINTAEKITEGEFNSLRHNGSQSLFRDAGTVTHSVGDTLNLQKDDKISTINARVLDVKTIERGTMTDDQFLEFVQQFGNFKTIADFENSKLFATKTTTYSKLFPQVYKFLNEGAQIDVIEFERQFQDIDFDYTAQIEFSNFIKDITETKKMYNPQYGIMEDVKSIKPEYLNPEYTNMSAAEKTMLELFERESKASAKEFESGSLVKSIKGVHGLSYYKIPTHHKTNLERRATLDVKGMFRDKLQFLKGEQADEIEYGESINSKKEVVRKLAPHYRGQIDSKDQSLDLTTIYRKEAEQRIRHSYQKKAQAELGLLIDISSAKDYIVTKKGVPLLNRNAKNANVQTTKGTESNEVQKLKGIMESFVYDTFTHSSIKIGNVELNKVASLVNGSAAAVALTLNEASGVANIINGMMQLNLDAIGGQTFNLKTLKRAEARYTKDLINITSDLTKPNKTSFTNQMVQMFDVLGGISLAQQEYIKDSISKNFISSEMGNMFNETGEHMMTSILTYAILDSIKVMSTQGNYISKVTRKGDSKITEKEGASLLDMLEMNKDGVLVTNKEVHYTSHSPSVPYHAGGKAHVGMLIKKRSHDLFGAYDPMLQGEIMKKWYGKMLMMFKRFFVPGLQHRWRGYTHILVNPNEVTEEQSHYNNWTKSYEEGYYVTFIKMLYQSAKNLKTHGLSYMPSYYNSLTSNQQANLRKATAELIVTTVLLPALAYVIAAMGGDDDDKPYFALYQVSRLGNELGTFYNPKDLGKLVKNPIAGFNIIDKSLNLLGEITTPFKLSPDDDESHFDWLNSDGEGRNRLSKSFFSITPGISRAFVEYKDMYNQFK